MQDKPAQASGGTEGWANKKRKGKINRSGEKRNLKNPQWFRTMFKKETTACTQGFGDVKPELSKTKRKKKTRSGPPGRGGKRECGKKKGGKGG